MTKQQSKIVLRKEPSGDLVAWNETTKRIEATGFENEADFASWLKYYLAK